MFWKWKDRLPLNIHFWWWNYIRDEKSQSLVTLRLSFYMCNLIVTKFPATRNLKQQKPHEHAFVICIHPPNHINSYKYPNPENIYLHNTDYKTISLPRLRAHTSWWIIAVSYMCIVYRLIYTQVIEITKGSVFITSGLNKPLWFNTCRLEL